MSNVETADLAEESTEMMRLRPSNRQKLIKKQRNEKDNGKRRNTHPKRCQNRS